MKFLSRRAAATSLALALGASACGGAAEPAASTVDADVATAPTGVPTTAPAAAVPAPTQAAAPTEQSAAPTEVSATVEPAEAPTAEQPTEPAEPIVETVAVDLPAVEVYDLATGTTADLAAFAKPGPTLVWFWAPH